MNYQVYQVTNKSNGRYYIGVHCGDIFSDNYYGSGLILNKAIKRYGKESFEREVIASFDNPHLALFLESVLVPEEIANDRECYNVTAGGGKPPVHIADNHPKIRVREKQRQEIKNEYLSGKTLSYLADKHNVSKTTICYVLDVLGVKRRSNSEYKKPTGNKHHQWRHKDEDDIVGRYQRGDSTYKIARDLGFADITISRILKKRGVKMRSNKDYISKSVVQKCKDGNILNVFASQRDAQGATGIDSRHISACVNSRRKTAGGYIWEHYK